jgi:hypothetical protein
MGLFEGDPTCKFCRKEAETVSTLSAAARLWPVSTIMFLEIRRLTQKNIRTASVRDLCLFIQGIGLYNLS